MGITIQAWRARIGLHCRGPPNMRSAAPIFSSLILLGGLLVMSLSLINILLLIGCIEANPGPYQCPTCNAALLTLTAYVTHHAVHSRDKNYTLQCCICHHPCPSSAAFFTHYRRFHSATATDQASTSRTADLLSDVLLCVNHKCQEITCQEEFRTMKALKKHVEGHLRNGYVINCPFDLCKNRFSKITTFRTHVSQYHKLDQELIDVQTNRTFCINDEGRIGFNDDDDSDSDNASVADTDDEEDFGEEDVFFDCDDLNHEIQQEINAGRDNIYPENTVRDHAGKFYLWLEGVLLIPAVKVQAISQQIALLLEMSHHRISVALKTQLVQAGIDAQRSDDIINFALARDIVFATHHRGKDFVNLTTEFMRNKFYKERCAFLEPIEVPLGRNDSGKNRFAHRFSVKETLETMFNDPSIQEQIDASFDHTSTPGTFQDFTDGKSFTDHPICSLMKSIQLIFFQDAFEFYPLSPTAGTYKCVGFYFLLGNLSPKCRSKVDAIQLAFIVKESDLKYFGPAEVLKDLLNELSELANTGIQYKNETLPVVTLHMCGDNLGQHYIGGFLESFTGEYYCRFCEARKKIIEKNPSYTMPFRTPEDYNQVIASINPDDPLDYQKGIKKKSVLNEIPFFHVSNPAQPPCAGHDILEGVARNDYALFLRYFIEVKEWVNFDSLNRRIANFKSKGRDAADSLVMLEPSLKKIRGHASEVWLFVRMFPFLIGDHIKDQEDPVWKLALLLKSICEYVFAPIITDVQLVKLKQMIALYVETRANLFSKKLQPKHHYLCHYAELVTYFGPLIRLWTLRFESRHVFFKQAAKCANNFKNITKTLANKYVLNFAYKFTGFMFPPSIVYKQQNVSPFLKEEMQPEVLQIFEEDPSFNQVLKSVDIHGITYCPELWVVLGAKNSNLIVGEILLVLYNGQSVKFVLKICSGINSNLGYYCIDNDKQFGAILHQDLVDYYPLPAYEFQNEQCLTLKHTSPFFDVYNE